MVLNNINLVIPRDKDMSNFIRYMAYKIETLDGINKSATPLINSIIEHRLKSLPYGQVNQKKFDNVERDVRHFILKKTELKYRILIIR